MNSNYRRLFEENPDDINVHKELAKLDPEEKWIYATSSRDKLFELGLSENIYSDIEPARISQQYEDFPSICAVYPAADINLSRFLFESIHKQDVIKPFGNNNIRGLTSNKCYIVENAKVICSNLSICILDSKNQIIRQCSHNSPESLLIWFNKNSPKSIELDDAGFASVQQTFNLGHWYIDSLSRIISLTEVSDRYKTIPWLIDTTNHVLVKKALEVLGIESYMPTLPASIYKVKKLYVPVVPSFSKKVEIASKFLKENSCKMNRDCRAPRTKFGGGRIFLSRQGQKRRKILNWEAVKTTLDRYEIDIIRPEDYSIAQISEVLEGTDMVIAPNGAAVCNTLMCKKGVGDTKIIYPTTHIDDYYFRVTEAMGRRFAGILNGRSAQTQTTGELIESYYYPSIGDDYEVDVDSLESLIVA